MDFTWESWIEGPRWRLPVATISKAALDYGLKVEDLREDKTWTKRVIFFRVTGEQANILNFQRALAHAVREANAGW